MSAASKRRPALKVVLGWHMHQPEYRDAETGEFHGPWTYLHALKDYSDMAAHLEAAPAAQAVVNFSPVLLDQIEDYSVRLERLLEDGRGVGDPVLDALHAPPPREDMAGRRAIVSACLRANERRVVDRFAPFRRLADIAALAGDDVAYLDDAFLGDLGVWYHLAWLGESVRRTHVTAKRLIDKAREFDAEDRRALLQVIADVVSGIVPRWRGLAEGGRVEVGMSPYAHPMLPLLIDWAAARESLPEADLPAGAGHPRGRERARWHIEEGIAVFLRHFGAPPAGCWPSEGGVSDAALALLEQADFRWVATGEGVLRHSLDAGRGGGATADATSFHRPYRIGEGSLRCFFRDDHLSDLIGFTFADWHADDAVANLVHALERIADALPHPEQRIVTIFLDGENAWEFYPENGWHFLSALYARLADHPGLELTTFSAALESGVETARLPRLVAGSWVHGTFSTWIGEPAKNRAWELLAEAAAALERAEAAGRLGATRGALARRQLAVCEGSDWFWWLGDVNPAESVRDFDAIYRRHLASLYRMIGEPLPAALSRPLARGGGAAEAGGTMRRGTEG